MKVEFLFLDQTLEKSNGTIFKSKVVLSAPTFSLTNIRTKQNEKWLGVTI